MSVYIHKLQERFRARLRAINLFDETTAKLAKTSPWYHVGGMFYFYWLVVMLTGLFLMLYYIPTIEQAFDSIDHIQHNVFLGWLMRGFHKYGADAMIILITIRIYRMYFTGEYKYPNEFNFAWGIFMLLLAMFSGLTGYLLIWNQRAYWASKVFATFPTYIDQIPGLAWQFLGRNTAFAELGGGGLGQATMTNFLAAHLGMSVIALIFVELYFYKTQLKRMNIGYGHMLAMLAILFVITVLYPVESGSPANPVTTPNPIFSDWYFLAVYQMLKYQHPVVATIATVAIPFVAIALAFLDRGPEKAPLERPLYLVIGIYALVSWIAFSVLIIMNIANIKRDPPYWYGSMIIALVIGFTWEFLRRRGKQKKKVLQPGVS